MRKLFTSNVFDRRFFKNNIALVMGSEGKLEI